MVVALRSNGAGSASAESHDSLGATQPTVGMFFDDALGPERASAVESSSLQGRAAGQLARPATAGVHDVFLPDTEGNGYWELSRLGDHCALSIIDAVYRQNRWIRVVGWRFFKLRLLLAGQLIGATGEILATAPQAQLYVSPGTSEEGYFIAGGQEIKLIVLHCRQELLERTLGLDSTDLPSLLAPLAQGGCSSSVHGIDLSAAVRNAAQRIFDSRPGAPSILRAAHLESMAMTIMCEVLGELLNRDVVRNAVGTGVQERDLNRIYEVRDHLDQHFVAPPTIAQLARMVGVNQTKLKIGFKRVLGMTIYQYIVRCRMELAFKLLLTRKYQVSEIAYRVGYEYPTNFTYAFKKHFGCLPHAWVK